MPSFCRWCDLELDPKLEIVNGSRGMLRWEADRRRIHCVIRTAAFKRGVGLAGSLTASGVQQPTIPSGNELEPQGQPIDLAQPRVEIQE